MTRACDNRGVTSQNVHHGREYWARIVAAYASSGLTQRAYCERNGLKFTAFRNWVYRLRSNGDAQSGRKRAKGQFVQLVPALPKAGVLCKVQVGKAELFFSELPPVGYLSEMLRLMDR